MTANYLIGLDIGGSGGRCLVINAHTGRSTIAYRPWKHPRAVQAGGWAYDLDTEAIWRGLGQTVKEALHRAGISAQDVAGIAAAGFRYGFVLVNREGKVLSAMPNIDARASNFGMDLAMENGVEIARRTGHYPGAIFASSRLMWLKANQPQVLREAQVFLSVSDWIGYKLTGNIAAEPCQAGESGLYDIHTGTWAKDLIQIAGAKEEIFPKFLPAGARLGELSLEAAELLGLAAGIPVAVGSADTQSGLMGAGAIAAGQMGIIAGTTTPIQLVVAKPVIDPDMHTWSGLHVIPGLYILESNAGPMGTTLSWIAGVLYAGASNPEAMLDAEALNSIPGAGGMISSVGAQIFNASAMSMPVDNLTFSSMCVRSGIDGRADMARAVLEGMAYALHNNSQQNQKVAGVAVNELWLGGGMSRSTAWAQIISDVTDCKVNVSALTEVTALGAAIYAGVGAGVYPDLQAGARVLGQIGRQYQPGEASKIYPGIYADWLVLRQERSNADEAAANQFVEIVSAHQAATRTVGSASFRPRIYISADVDETALERLRQLGEVTYASYREGKMLVGEELVETLEGYHVFVTEVDIISAEDLAKLDDLRMVAVCRGNPVNIDVNACTAAGIPVVNTPARNADAVADLVIAFMLMLARKIHVAMTFMREPGSEAGDMGRMGMAHEQFLGMELWRKTVGVVGGGAVGRKVIQRLLPFETRILLYDPYLSAEQAVLMGAQKVDLEPLLVESDMITLHAPVTEETRGMIDVSALAKMKPGALLINTARAALVNNEALLEALRSGKLGGAGLDVFPVEPPGADDPLLALPNVVATPHLGGNTAEVAAHQGAIVADELQALLTGNKPHYILNPTTLVNFSWSDDRKVDLRELKKLAGAPGPGVTDLDASAAAATSQKKSTPTSAEKKGGLLTSLKKVLGGEKTTVSQPVATLAPLTAGGGPREMMVHILDAFTTNVLTDAGMAEFAQGKNVTFLFTVKDLDQEFFLSFIEGQVGAGLGQPSQEPDVRLKMSADTLDGMFTGRVNAMKAAMGGKLSFSGDTGKAMAFQRIQKDMGRLYSAAREKIGDPGDLINLGSVAPPSAAPLPVGVAAQPAVTGYGAPTVIKTGDVRDQILAVTNELYARGLITPTGGNVSARCDDNPAHIWITPSAIFKGDLRPDMMVRIDLDGHIIGDTEYSASSERRVHCAIYKSRPDIEAVVHSHALYATLMAMAGLKFLPLSTEAAFLGDIPVVPFILPGTDELGKLVAEALGKGAAVIMQNHGLVVAGSSLRRASDMSDVVEVTAHKIITCRILGVEPSQLPEEALSELREVGKMIV